MTIEEFNKLRMNWSFSLCGGINETKKRHPLKRQPLSYVHAIMSIYQRYAERFQKALLGISSTSAITCKRHCVTLLSKPNSPKDPCAKKIIRTCDWKAGEEKKKEVEIGGVIRREAGSEWGAESGWFVEQGSGSAGARKSGGGMMRSPGEMGVAK